MKLKKNKKKFNDIIKIVKNIFIKIKSNIFLTSIVVGLLVLIIGIQSGIFFKAFILVILLLAGTYYIEYKGDIMKRIKGKDKRKDKKKKNKIWNRILNFSLIVIVCGIILVAGFVGYIVLTAPDFNPNNLYQKEASIIYDADGEIIAKLGTEIRDKITYDEMPQILIDAITATEDARFNQHNGFDLPRFMKASFGQLTGNSSAGGASTITMQVVKNNFTSTKQSVKRKFTDIYMAIFKLEKNYSKEEIFEFYVNAPYLGASSYGVAEASRNYFGKEVKDLNLSEAALLAGLFQAPGYYDPFINPDRAEERRSTVLYLMRRHGYISKEEEDFANLIPVSSLLVKGKASQNEYQSFIDTVVNEVEEKTGKNPYSVSMAVYTTLNKSIQDGINKAMNGETYTWINETVQAGVAITDTQTGAIVALGGGRNVVGERVFNFATMLNKQPGSTAKPLFDYGPGVEYNNWSTYTPFIDDRYSYSNGLAIQNWDEKYLGFLTLKQALGLSRNIPALKAFQQTAMADKVAFVTGLGMKPEIDGGTIHEAHALGAFTGTNPLQMAAAYAAFGNGGYYIKPYTVNKVVYTETSESKIFKAVKNKVMSDSTAYIITNSLIWATNSGMSYGARYSGYEVAAKTGTTNFAPATIKAYGLSSGALNDLWTIAYTSKYSIGLWYGYDKIDKSAFNTVNDVNRKDRLFKEILKSTLPGTSRTFDKPSSIAAVEVEKNTMPAMLPSTYTPSDMRITEYFKKGTEPTDVSERYKQLPNASNLVVTESGNKLVISWDSPNNPTYYTSEYQTAYFAENYGAQAEKYLNIHNTEVANTIGTIGYEVYYRDSAGNIMSLGYTNDNSIEINKPLDIQDMTFIVKTEFSIFKSNISDGVEVDYTNIPVDNVEVVAVGGNTTVDVGTPYTEPIPAIRLTDNSVDSTDLITSITKNIIKESTNLSVSSISTNKKETYTIYYTITYLGKVYNTTKTVVVK